MCEDISWNAQNMTNLVFLIYQKIVRIEDKLYKLKYLIFLNI